MSDNDQPAYRLTEWEQVKDQDAEVCHLIDFEDEDREAIIATFSRCEFGARLAAAALELANGNVALTASFSIGSVLPVEGASHG